MDITRKCNEDYFEIIDTEDKAYWLGFLYADGCVSKDGKQTVLGLANEDVDHIKLFNKCIKSTYEITHPDNNRYSRLTITKKKFTENLINKGCVPAKSLILKFPTEEQVPKKLLKHFIRGYFDGDGCLSTILRTIKGKPNPIMDCEVNFLGTLDMLTGITENIPIKNIRIFKFGKIYKFRIRNKKDIITLLDYLYEDSHFYLKRKYNKYLDNVKNYITKRHPSKNK